VSRVILKVTRNRRPEKSRAENKTYGVRVAKTLNFFSPPMFFGLMISVSLAPGCGDNDRGSAIQGGGSSPTRNLLWSCPRGGTVVRVPFEAGNGIIAGSYRIDEKSVPLLFRKLSNVGSRAHHEGDAVGFAVTNRELTLIRDRRSTVFRREDPPAVAGSESAR
jgi:hypothetical protein